MKQKETKITGYSSWLTMNSATSTNSFSDDLKQDEIDMPQYSSLPASLSWPCPNGIIDLYEGKKSRFAQLRFYLNVESFPLNGMYLLENGTQCLVLHDLFESFGPALTMLTSGVEVYLGYNLKNHFGWLDTATRSPLP